MFSKAARLQTLLGPVRHHVSKVSYRRCVAASAEIEKPDVRKLAQMAHIDVTDEEVCFHWLNKHAYMSRAHHEVSRYMPNIHCSWSRRTMFAHIVPRSLCQLHPCLALGQPARASRVLQLLP